MSKTTQQHLGWLVLIMLVSGYLATRMLAVDILFVDEYWSIRNSGGTFGPLGFFGIWERTATIDPGGMGVLYHWLLGAWEYLIGISPFSVRAFSLLAGLLAISAMYRFGRDFFSPRIGLYSAGILALSAFFIDYMHEARAYSLLALFTILAVYCYLKIMSYDRAHWGWYIGLSLMLGALAYTHYVALAMGLVLGIYHLTCFNNSRKWWLVVLAMAIGGALFLPWLSITLEVIQRGTEDTGRQDDSMNAMLVIQNLLHTVSNANFALLALTAFYSLQNFSRKTAFVWIWILVSLVVVILVNFFIPFMVHLRYLMFVFPAFALMIALGISKMKNFSLAILLVWFGAGIYQSVNPTFIDEQFGQIYRASADGFNRTLDTLNTRADDSDMVLFHIMPPELEPFNLFPLDYYFVETELVTPDVRFDQYERINNSFAGGDVDYLNDVTNALADVDFIWSAVIPEVPQTQRSGVVDYVLATQYDHCEAVFSQDDMEMALYARQPQITSITTFGDNTLVLYDLEHGLVSDNRVNIVLGWWSDDRLEDIYSVGVHLFDAENTLVRQQDFGLVNQRRFRCNSASLDLSDLSAGTYNLRITVYEWQSGTRLLTNDDSDYIDFQEIVIEE